MKTMTKKDEGKRYWFECENGRRWSECSHSGNKSVKPYGPQSKDGDTCYFSGCLQDHKIKLVKITEKDDESIHGWFRGWEKWEDSPVYQSLND